MTIRPSGENPPYGAGINYYLKSAPTGAVTITIQDSKGQTVRTMQRAARRRVCIACYWDLRDAPSKRVDLSNEPALRAGDSRRRQRHP